ncbi:hypothetical protein [Celeribacter arenosi]|uniref:hypothetical protein n=1 Tax=Celeribacter arenosi TaxID=792649 RepID=UPI0031DA13DD
MAPVSHMFTGCGGQWGGYRSRFHFEKAQRELENRADHAALHNPDYDFPDDLIPIGSAIFERIARDLLGSSQAG